jgi:hypothetical protein
VHGLAVGSVRRVSNGARGVVGAGRGLEDRVGQVMAVVFLQLSWLQNGIAVAASNQRCSDGRRMATRGVAELASKGVRGQADGQTEETGPWRAWLAVQLTGFATCGRREEQGSGGGFGEESGR